MPHMITFISKVPKPNRDASKNCHREIFTVFYIKEFFQHRDDF